MTDAAPRQILETILYAEDLAVAEAFYSDVLGLTLYSKSPSRQLFYKLSTQMLLIFNPTETLKAPDAGARLPVPPHGAVGEGHVCFAATADDISNWKTRLEAQGIAIEADFHWPGGGRSLYFRDPAGNCLEFAEPRIWGF